MSMGKNESFLILGATFSDQGCYKSEQQTALLQNSHFSTKASWADSSDTEVTLFLYEEQIK